MNMTEVIASLKNVGSRAAAEGRRRWTAERIGWGVMTATAVALAGCSDGASSKEAPVFPVKGTVRFEGEPAAGAFVVFHARSPARPGEQPVRPTAQVQPDGTFELTTTSQADGAPAGDYAVTVRWTKLIKQGGDTIAGPDAIPPIYARPDTTPLKVTVRDAPNELEPFKITKK